MKRHIPLLTAVYMLLLAAIIGYGFFLSEPVDSQVIRATVTADEIRISAKIPGRVETIAVQQGDVIAAGDLVFQLASPEISAKEQQAKALIAAKTALKDRAIRGARDEEVALAKEQLEQASTSAELAEKSLQRVSNLFKEGLVPEQQLDEASAAANGARFAKQAALQRYTMALNGTESELITAAQSDLRAAEGVLAEVNAALAETKITAQRAGEVTSVLIHEGEIAPAGFPVVTLVDMADAYIRFHVNELALAQFKLDSEFNAYIPALERQVTFRTRYVSALGDYANWQASKPGEYDLTTFEIHAQPIQEITDWRVGMSVIIEQGGA